MMMFYCWKLPLCWFGIADMSEFPATRENKMLQIFIYYLIEFQWN